MEGACSHGTQQLSQSRGKLSEEGTLHLQGHLKLRHSSFYVACRCIWSVSTSVVSYSEKGVIPVVIYIGYLVLSSCQPSLSSVSLTPESIVGKNSCEEVALLWVRGFWCSVLSKTKSHVEGKLKEASLVEGFSSAQRCFGAKLYILACGFRLPKADLRCPFAWSETVASAKFPVMRGLRVEGVCLQTRLKVRGPGSSPGNPDFQVSLLPGFDNFSLAPILVHVL